MSYVSKSEEAKQEIIRQIKASAKTMFYERGFELIAMHDIAKEVGVTQRTMHKLFVNKTDVYYAIIASIYEDISNILFELGFESVVNDKKDGKKIVEKDHKQDVKQEVVVELLKRFFNRYMEKQKHDFSVFLLLSRLPMVSKQIDPIVIAHKEVFQQQLAGSIQMLEQLFSTGISRGELRDDIRSNELVITFLTNFIGFFTMLSIRQAANDDSMPCKYNGENTKDNEEEKQMYEKVWGIEQKILLDAICKRS